LTQPGFAHERELRLPWKFTDPPLLFIGGRHKAECFAPARFHRERDENTVYEVRFIANRFISIQPDASSAFASRSGSPAIQFGIRAHHRFSHPDCPFPLLYVGASIPACLWKYFGDDVSGGQRVISAAQWNGCSLSRIAVPQLEVSAVSQEPTRGAMGADKASLLAVDLNVPQAWGLAVQQHPATSGLLPGNSTHRQISWSHFDQAPACFIQVGLASRMTPSLSVNCTRLLASV